MIRLFWVFSVLALSVHPSFAADQCPKGVVFSGASFINHQQFPTDAQVETNLRQTFHLPGEASRPTYGSTDSKLAKALVQALKSAYMNNQLVLRLTSDAHRGCLGRIGSFEYTYNAYGNDILFVMNQGVFQDETRISVQNHAPVLFQIDLPGNCSGCAREMELFEFQQAYFLP